MNSKTIFENNLKGEENAVPESHDEEFTRRASGGGILSYPIERLIKKYQTSLVPLPKGEVSTIHVDEIASKVAHFYERVRKIVDWKEENLLRRSAILRILKRSMIAEISNLKFIFRVNIEAVAEPLVLELIRGGHLANDEIPKEKISEVDRVVKKYFYLLRNAPFEELGPSFPLKQKVNFYDWIMEIASCEIEEVLAPPVKENTLMETMTALLAERIKLLPVEQLTEEEKTIQTYIAVHRTLFDLDDGIITYHLLKYKNSSWVHPADDFLKETAKIFLKLKKESIVN